MFKRTIVILMISMLGLLMTACQKSSTSGAGYVCRYRNTHSGQIFMGQAADQNAARNRARMDCQSSRWPQSCRWLNCRYQGQYNGQYDGRYSNQSRGNQYSNQY